MTSGHNPHDKTPPETVSKGILRFIMTGRSYEWGRSALRTNSMQSANPRR